MFDGQMIFKSSLFTNGSAFAFLPQIVCMYVMLVFRIEMIKLCSQVRDQQNVGGRGRGRGRPDGNGQNFGNNNRNRSDLPEIHYAVPANKCGLVIGKGMRL